MGVNEGGGGGDIVVDVFVWVRNGVGERALPGAVLLSYDVREGSWGVRYRRCLLWRLFNLN